MLQAKLKNGHVLTLAKLTVSEIQEFKEKKEAFFCPTCMKPVMIKAGPKMIPHFAHYSSENCPSQEGGEGTYHEQGKLLLFNWLKSQNLNVELEAYISSIQQRPDILLTINNKKIAIEYQCARLKVDQVQKRNKGYLKAGIVPIWILGANRFQRQTGNHIKLDSFTQQFIHRFTPELPTILYYFCPHTHQLISVQDLFFTRGNQALGKFYIKHINQSQFTDLFKMKRFSKHELMKRWKKEKERFRTWPRRKIYGSELAWHQWLYLNKMHIELLPSIVYLPIPSQYLMRTPLWNWQSRICMDFLSPLPVGAEFSILSVNFLLRNQLQSSSTFPLIQSSHHPIKQYFQLLTYLEIIQPTTEFTYKKLQSIQLHSNIHDALKQDEMVLNKIIHKRTNKIQA
ncbi:competence protein CoiA [Oceanobacillus halophilus]|uniref:Competence protein CoiA n=1 Tax=Oceanobacillus halophilus TaxID=930130 RepID=A0A495A3B2_9BACI|nr:competence protein CoiA family protein [Oceanobacillus halophilus]RKQ32629.1 hypothetical protein D8M06_11870 [Oceanobacillus halophilus]